MSASSTVAERLIIPLLPEAKFQDVIEEIKSVPGFLGGHWGMKEGVDNTLEAVIFWQSLESNQSTAIVELTKPISRDLVTDYHIVFNPSVPTTILTSPITEMLTFHGLPADFTEEGLVGFLSMVAGSEGCLGVAKGPALEEVAGGHAWVVMIGWESLEANVAGQKSEAFAKATKLHFKTEMHHVKFQKM